MTEFTLNHMSFSYKNESRSQIAIELCDLVRGITSLVRHQVSLPTLRTSFHWYEINCTQDYNALDILLEMQNQGYREEYEVLISISTKLPLISDEEIDLKNRFLNTENLELDNNDGAPLLLCAISGCIAVSLPSEKRWDRSQLKVNFEELTDNDEISEHSSDIDNIAREIHASEIIERFRRRFIDEPKPSEIWQNRSVIFPCLTFGLDVERNLHREANRLSDITEKLWELNETAQEWANTSGSSPRWRTSISNESVSVKNHPMRERERTFKSVNGMTKTYYLHMKIGSRRIHFDTDGTTRTIEIGYIGPHLPL